MDFMQMNYDQQSLLIAQLMNASSQSDHGDGYIAQHPELRNRDVIKWTLGQATMFRDHYRELISDKPSFTLSREEKLQLAKDKLQLAFNLAAVAFILGGEIRDSELGAQAAEFIANTAEETGDKETAHKWKLTALALR